MNIQFFNRGVERDSDLLSLFILPPLAVACFANVKIFTIIRMETGTYRCSVL